MFESVAPETFVPRNRKLWYESLPASIAAHAALAVTLVVAGTWEITFPSDSPRLYTSYSIALEPTPPPPPPAPKVQAQIAPKPVTKQDPVTAPQEIVAPTIIPDEIPIVEPIAAVEGSVGEGPPNTLIVKRHHPLPTAMTPMSMVYPFYPEEARVRGWEDAVAVRYIIGKDGRVKSVEVLEKPEREVFQKSVVNAIRHWRFRPLMKAGVPQEVIHELVIYFKLNA